MVIKLERKYLVLADIHGDKEKLDDVLESSKQYEIDSVILNGDIKAYGQSFTSLGDILNKVRKSHECEVYVIPGSHEEKMNYDSTLKIFEELGITDGTKKPTEDQGLKMVFVSGSDWFSDGGNYEMDLSQVSGIENDDKVLLVSHVPGYGLNDVAEFGQTTAPIKTRNGILETGTVIPGYEQALELEKQGVPIKAKREHRGNKKLREIIEERKIKFGISAHFHESPGLYNIINRSKVPENKFTDSLFYNPGPVLDKGDSGIYTIQLERGKLQAKAEKI